MSRSYRITYDHRTGKFVIEVMGFAGLTWSAARESGKALYFETFDAASAHVKSIGLDRVYQDATFKAPFGAVRVDGNYPKSPAKTAHASYNIVFPSTIKDAA